MSNGRGSLLFLFRLVNFFRPLVPRDAQVLLLVSNELLEGVGLLALLWANEPQMEQDVLQDFVHWIHWAYLPAHHAMEFVWVVLAIVLSLRVIGDALNTGQIVALRAFNVVVLEHAASRALHVWWHGVDQHTVIQLILRDWDQICLH